MAEKQMVVSVRNVSVQYPGRGMAALREVSLDILAGCRIGLTGPSGCGKSTLARCMARWQNPSAGEIVRHGDVQMVMQDPGTSLNLRFTAYQVVEEPLRIANRLRGARARIELLLDRMGIARADAQKSAGRFSGGERARLAIARALAGMDSETGGLLILDESLAALDSETRARILVLLEDLRAERNLAILLISHDMDLLAGAVDTSIEMDAGKITCAG